MPNFDCNTCKYLSCTEAEQDHLKRVFDELIPHVCTKYNKRVIHICSATRSLNHSSYLHPCEECNLDNNIHYFKI